VKSIFGWLVKKLGKAALDAAPIAASAVHPWLGKLMAFTVNAIQSAETTHGDGAGEIKQAAVTTALGSAEPLIAGLIVGSGAKVINKELFADGMADVREGIVKLMKATGQLGKVEADTE
jgi:hypothetical protein